MQPSTAQLQALSTCFLFRNIPEKTLLSMLAALPSPQVFHKGETVYEPASFCHALALVLEGELRVSPTPTGTGAPFSTRLRRATSAE